MTKRKTTAAREPNGRIQRAPVLPSPGEVRRLRDAAISGMRDPLWGTQLGRLYLAGKVSEEQLAAGKRWAEMATRYSAALLSPSADPKAISLDIARSHPFDPDSNEGRAEVRRHQRAVESFIDASVAVLGEAKIGAKALAMVRVVCEKDIAPAGFTELEKLIGGLSALADFWGLRPSRKSPNVR